MGPVSPPPSPPQQRRWRHAHERVPSFSAPSEVIRVPARAAVDGAPPPPPRSHHRHHHFSKILVLPGNPGCSSFYAPFAEALSDELGGETEVVALSFYGHETLTKRERREKLSLDKQVEHASSFLEKLLSEVDEEGKDKENRGLSVAVVGHSIGGTVAALAVREVEERRRSKRREKQQGEEEAPSSKVSAVCAMMPYVAFDETSQQQRALRLLAGTPPARAAACLGARAIGALLPRAALSALVGFATGGASSSSPLTKHARETVADFARNGGLGHALFLADTEFRALSVGGRREEVQKQEGLKFSLSSAAEIWGPLASLGRRASVFAVGRKGESDGDEDGDHWCPNHHLDLLKKQAPWMRVELDPNQRHDFVACAGKGTARAARAVAGLLRETAALAAAAEES